MVVLAEMSWSEEELKGIELGDKRLNRRAASLLERFSEKPTASIPNASRGWSETQAAYRFFSNESVSWEKILAPHWEQTQIRMSQHKRVLCIQDTTELNFNGQEIEGLGPLSYESQRGMYVHPTYMVTPDRESLGVMDAWMWARAFKDANGVRAGIVESTRWIEGYERLAELAPKLSETRLVYVADREADMLALLVKAHDLGEPLDYVIRAKHNRSLPNGELLWAKVEVSESLGEIHFMLPKRHGVKPRAVRQSVYAQRVRLENGRGGTLETTCVVAKEHDAPSGTQPIIWRLLSNCPVSTLEEAVTLIEWYRTRWEIERFFDVLKNACRVEALQLAYQERLERALALFMIVAWRIVRLMRLGRSCPDLDAELFFEPIEWKVAFALLKKKTPTHPPTLNTVIRTIAMLGGFLGRKSDGEPGAKTLWIGLQRVFDAILGIEAAKSAGLL